jgi:tetratricopeptide (TPR) repeat protein
MQWERELPRPAAWTGGVVVLEAARGQSRRRLLQGWVDAAAAEGATGWLLPCDLHESGLWAGVTTVAESLVPLAERHAPELLEEHAIELAAVVPELRPRLEPPETLTDTATGSEAVRNYAVDRAYRINHGLIDLLDAVSRRASLPPRLALACDDYDLAGALVRRFFQELMRRRGQALGITLVLAVDPGGADAALATFDPAVPVRRARIELPSDVVVRTPQEMTALARELDRQVRRDVDAMENRVPELIRFWLQSEYPQHATVWQAFALGRYNHRGFYEDALTFADAVLENLDRIADLPGGFTRWNLVGSIFGSLVTVGDVERAYRVVKEKAYDRIADPTDRARICYIMAMLHGRFLPERDLEKAEAYLAEGLTYLDDPAVEPEDRHFLYVFLNNGLALIRHRQGRPAEAVTLCEDGFAHLKEHIAEDRYRLHRSVLLYNIAQVYMATREYETALRYFAGAMEMDPYYSEYFNERGNALLKLGRLDEAIADYREAIRLSPPYPEVWINLGQCYRKMGRLQEAADAYARAVDLDPGINLARVTRGRVLEQLGRAEEALAEYDAALALDPAQPLVLANRAALRFGAGRVHQAAEDLERAVGLAPANPGLRRNRAVALAALGRAEEEAGELAAYLELAPDAPDRHAVEERLAALGMALAPA